MKYKYQKFIDYQKADPAGIVYFAEVYPISHQAFEEFIHHINIGWSNWFNHKTIATPIVHSECDYYSPMFAGQTYFIDLFLSKIGNSSLTVEYIFYDKNKTKCCQVKTVHACINKAKLTKISLPIEYKDKLNLYLTES